MPDKDYSKGKIYMVFSPSTNLKYIGSTIMTLNARFRSHKRKQNCSSKVIIQAGDAEIILLHKFPCDSLKELETEEGRVQDLYPDKVNIYRAGRTVNEKRIRHNKYCRERYAKKPQSEKSREITQEQRDKINKHRRERAAKKREAAKTNSLDISN